MAQIDYIVVVYPAPPATRTTASMSVQYSHDQHQPKVKMVTARSPEKAAQIVGVAPGGHAFVVQKSQAHRFDRAKEAPLVPKTPSGGDFAEDGPRAA